MNLENLNVQELNNEEQKNIEGGRGPAYWLGYAAGKTVAWLEWFDNWAEGDAV